MKVSGIRSLRRELLLPTTVLDKADRVPAIAASAMLRLIHDDVASALVTTKVQGGPPWELQLSRTPNDDAGAPWSDRIRNNGFSRDYLRLY